MGWLPYFVLEGGNSVVGPLTLVLKLTLELKLTIFKSLILGIDKLSSKAQTIENLTSLQAHNISSKLKTKKHSWQAPKMPRSPLAYGTQNESLIFGQFLSYLMEAFEDFDQELVKTYCELIVVIPHRIHQGTISTL